MERGNDTYQHLLEKTVSQYHTVSNKSLALIYAQSTIRTYLRNQIIASQGRTDAFEYFLLSGILHSYSISLEGEQVSTKIFPPQSVITPHIVRTLEGRSIQFLACLQDAVTAVVPMAMFNVLMNSNPDIRTFGFKVVENELASKTRREVSILTLTAKERLLTFRKEYSNLENLIPHSVIASYLGITPVSFSRLRNELATTKE